MRLCSFHKVYLLSLPTYLFNLISKSTQTRTSGNIPTYQGRTDSFKHSYFPQAVVTWCKIHPEIRTVSVTVFKKLSLKEICPVLYSVYNICNPNDLKLLTRLRIGLSHLNENRFNQNFEKSINPCSLEVESTSHFF